MATPATATHVNPKSEVFCRVSFLLLSFSDWSKILYAPSVDVPFPTLSISNPQISYFKGFDQACGHLKFFTTFYISIVLCKATWVIMLQQSDLPQSAGHWELSHRGGLRGRWQCSVPCLLPLESKETLQAVSILAFWKWRRNVWIFAFCFVRE